MRGVRVEWLLRFLSAGLHVSSPPTSADLILVLAGRTDRHRFGVQLWRKGLASRLLLSIGRFDARQVAPFIPDRVRFQEMVRATPPRERHFIADFTLDASHFLVAKSFRRGTYPELEALAAYLEERPPKSITIVSTGLHLRRVRYCCRRISFFRNREIHYLAVPDEMSSFPRPGWSYVAREYAKLLLYALVYRGK